MFNTSSSSTFRSGFVALVGRPNAGKSTLLNSCIGTKVAITSPVAQTTRKRLRAILTSETYQIVFVDTPGLHKPKDTLGNELNQSTLHEINDVDVIAFLIDASKPVGRGDEWVANKVKSSSAKKLLVLTKADKTSEEQVNKQLNAAQSLCDFDNTIVISARENFNVDSFINLLVSYLPEGPQWFPPEMTIDADDETLVAEFIREKVLRNTREEVPHSVGVLCDDIEYDSNITRIWATIYVEREGQKGIIIGHGGDMIKKIGSDARHDLQHWFDTKVYLNLDVKVKRDWRHDETQIHRFGYDAQAD